MPHPIGEQADAEQPHETETLLPPGIGGTHQYLLGIGPGRLRDLLDLGALELRNGDAEVARRAAHQDGVVAQAGVDLQLQAVQRAVEVHGVVATTGEQLQPFDVLDLRNVQPGAEDALHLAPVHKLGEDVEGVVDLGAHHHHGVEAGAAVDADGGVLHIGDGVLALAVVVHIDLLAGRLSGGVLCLGGEQRLDVEEVVVLLAVQIDLGRVVVDLEVVVPGAAIEVRREAHPIGDLGDHRDQPVAGIVHLVGGQHVADEEAVVAGVAMDLQLGGGIVHQEQIVPAAPARDEGLRGEIVDRLPRDVAQAGVAHHDLGAVVGHRREHRVLPAVAGPRGDALHDVPIEAEHVVLVGALHQQIVDARAAGIAHVYQRVELAQGGARELDPVAVAAGTPIEHRIGGEVVDEESVDAVDARVPTVGPVRVLGGEDETTEDPGDVLALAEPDIPHDQRVLGRALVDARLQLVHPEQAVAEFEVGVPGLDQGVFAAAGIGETVHAASAGEGVVPRTAVEVIHEGRAEQQVAPVAAEQGHHAQPVVRDGGGIQAVVARQGFDAQFVVGVAAVLDGPGDAVALRDQYLIPAGGHLEAVGAGAAEQMQQVGLRIQAIDGGDEGLHHRIAVGVEDGGAVGVQRLLQGALTALLGTGFEGIVAIPGGICGIDVLATLYQDATQHGILDGHQIQLAVLIDQILDVFVGSIDRHLAIEDQILLLARRLVIGVGGAEHRGRGHRPGLDLAGGIGVLVYAVLFDTDPLEHLAGAEIDIHLGHAGGRQILPHEAVGALAEIDEQAFESRQRHLDPVEDEPHVRALRLQSHLVRLPGLGGMGAEAVHVVAAAIDQVVGTVAEIPIDVVVARLAEEPVAAGAACQVVGTVAAMQLVLPFLTEQGIVAGAALQYIVAAATLQAVLALSSQDAVVPGAAQHIVATGTPQHLVVAVAGVYLIHPVTGLDVVVAATGHDDVVARTAEYPVRAVRRLDGVVTATPVNGAAAGGEGRQHPHDVVARAGAQLDVGFDVLADEEGVVVIGAGGDDPVHQGGIEQLHHAAGGDLDLLADDVAVGVLLVHQGDLVPLGALAMYLAAGRARPIVQGEGAVVELRDVGAGIGAVMVEIGQHLVHEGLARLEDGHLAEQPQVRPHPEEGIEEGAQSALHVEQAERVLVHPGDDLVHAQLAVVDEGGRLIVIGGDIVEVEGDVGADAALNAGLDQAAHPHRGARGDARIYRHLRVVGDRLAFQVVAVAADALHLVGDEEAVEDQRRVPVAAVEEGADAGGVETEAEIDGGPDAAPDAGVQAREDGEGLAIVEGQFHLRHVVQEQVHVLAQQQAQHLHRIGEQREPEAALAQGEAVAQALGLVTRGRIPAGIVQSAPGAAACRRRW